MRSDHIVALVMLVLAVFIAGSVWMEKRKKTMRKIIAYWRAFRGCCPCCNSDALEIDSCQVCQSWRGSFPPPDWLSATWLMRHFEPDWSATRPRAKEDQANGKR